MQNKQDKQHEIEKQHILLIHKKEIQPSSSVKTKKA